MRTFTLSLWLCTAFWIGSGWTTVASASEARETALVRAVRRAQASVANIHSERMTRDDSLFDAGPGRKVNGMGTGIIIDERGYIVTNEHVIANVESLRVTLYDGSTYMARVISGNRKHDLAVIKIEAGRPLPVIPLGTSCDLRLGETVIAIGNAFGYEHTVTQGIISHLSRDVEVNEYQSYENLLQTDASINPGNSGGPLLNLDGEVVGINVAIRAGAQRIGFAIPIDDARRCIATLLDIRRTSDTHHGILSHDVKTPEHRKLVVDAAEPNSPAATAGFQPGDVVVKVAAVPVVDAADLERALLGQPASTPVEVVVERGEKTVNLSLQLAKAEGAALAAASRNIQASARSHQSSGRPRITPADDPIAAKSWSILGLKLEKATAKHLEPFNNKYRGGMRVVDVRADSAAAKHGIRKGDILVGLHIWETVKPEDVNYVLSQTQLISGGEPLKFYVVRKQEVLYGNLRFAQLQK